MNKDQIGGIVRAIVSAIGGYFVGKGVIDADTVTTIGSAVAVLAATIWSVISNKTGTVAGSK